VTGNNTKNKKVNRRKKKGGARVVEANKVGGQGTFKNRQGCGGIPWGKHKLNDENTGHCMVQKEICANQKKR